MFGSRRKSRIVATGPLPGNSADVNANALAAASAIGQALKTGQPIPRSNSLQRTHTLQKRSFKSFSRSGSLLGLQTAPAQFKVSESQTARSQSLSSEPKPVQRKPASKPKTIKKHIPGPYGLVTIELPIEEQPAPKDVRRQNKSSSLKSPSRHHFSDVSSTHSAISTSSSKRATFAETKPLTEIQEDLAVEFKGDKSPVLPVTEPLDSLDVIEEEEKTGLNKETKPIQAPYSADSNKGTAPSLPDLEDASKTSEFDGESESDGTIVGDLNNLEKKKANEEAELKRQLDQEEYETQTQLNGTASNQIDISKSLGTSFPIRTSPIEDGPKATLVEVSDSRDSLDDAIADIPSTAKSVDTDIGQSSFTTQDTEPEVSAIKSGGSSMAQQLRPTIPTLFVNQQKDSESEPALNHPPLDDNGPASSISSADRSDEEARKKKALKSALKSAKSTSSVYLPEKPNAANDAYLSLTTAENTRLNSRIDEPTVSKSHIRRSPSVNRQSQQLLRPPQLSNRPKNNFSSPQRPDMTLEPNRQGAPRPPSAQGQHRPQIYHPQSQSPSKIPPRSHLRQPIPKKTINPASSAAALNASIKKEEPPRPERNSSFEKERPRDKNAAFKRMSLRDPAIQGHTNIESNLGFYRNQAHQQQKHSPQAQQTHQPPSQTQPSPSNLGGFTSRFNDSDSDMDVPIGNDHSQKLSQPPPQTLKKPKSHFTLRSPSANAIPEQSPAKSLPEKRNTRYFSDSAKLAGSRDNRESISGEKEKKSSFGGKLKKLFGRSSKD